MRIRRCAVLWIEAREVVRFELESLLSGGTGIVATMHWLAHAPHLHDPVELGPDDIALLGRFSPSEWVDVGHEGGRAAVEALLEVGLLVREDAAGDADRADARLREQHWFGPAALLHRMSRWEGLDAAGEVAQARMDNAAALRERYGPPPPAIVERTEPSQRIALPTAHRTAFDALLDRRATCRNFDPDAPLALQAFAQVLERVFHARGQVHAADAFDVLKKTSPSGGALHPTEAYLIVQRVEGIPPGLYHYHAGAHALEPLPSPGDVHAFARLAVAGQHWFAAAPALVVLAPRFARNAWKYRNHAKSYRTVLLDIGHLSQTLYLSATELGLGAFVTAAINEADIERAFGLESHVDGPLAVCGFGLRGAAMQRAELDPNGQAWATPDA